MNNVRLYQVVLLGILLGELVFLFRFTAGEDFWQHYFAAQALLLGSRDFAPAHAIPYQPIYPYPLFVAILLIPLSILPPKIALGIWISILYVSVGLSSFLICRWILEVDHDSALALTLLFMVWPITFVATFMGQVTPLILLIFILALGLYRHDKVILAGLCLSRGLMKPHLLASIILGLLIKRYWKVLTGFAFGSAILLAPSFVIGPGASMQSWQTYIWEWFIGSNRTVSLIRYLTILPGQFLLAISALGFLALAFWWWKKRKPTWCDALLGYSLSLLISPYVLAYDLVLLIPACLLRISQRDWRAWVAFALMSIASVRYGLAPIMTLGWLVLIYTLFGPVRTRVSSVVG